MEEIDDSGIVDQDVSGDQLAKKRNATVLVCKITDEIMIERDSMCFIVTIKGKQGYYTTYRGAFFAVDRALMTQKFAHLPDDAKSDLKQIIRLLDSHNQDIKELILDLPAGMIYHADSDSLGVQSV